MLLNEFALQSVNEMSAVFGGRHTHFISVFMKGVKGHSLQILLVGLIVMSTILFGDNPHDLIDRASGQCSCSNFGF